MSADLRLAIVRILNPRGITVGTGFILSEDGLVATCAHVVEAAGAGPGDTVSLVFHTTGQERQAIVEPESWCGSESEDVAILRLEGPLPEDIQCPPLGPSAGGKSHPFETFGFPNANPDEGLMGIGQILGETTIQGVLVLQLRSQEVAQGMSGAPLMDVETGRVVGMITRTYHPDKTLKFRDLAFATPADILIKACPDLERILQAPAAPLGKLSNVPNLPPHFLPRPDHLEPLKAGILTDVDKLVVVTGTTHKVGVQGMGGIGKSVLAAALARDLEVRRAFPDGVLWLTIGREPALTLRQSQLAEALGDPSRAFEDVQQGKARLSELLAEKACLLILDDVWDAEHAEAFDALGPGCRMLITTRDAGLIVALGATEHQLDVLNDEQALALLAQWAGQTAGVLPTEAREVARECGNLPLALAMVGAMVRSRPDRWSNALYRLRNADLEKIRQQFPGYPYPDLLRAIQVSVEALSPEVQARYLDLAVFPEDTPIPEATLVTFWAPEGMDKYDVQDVVDVLVDRSLARRDERDRLRLHDLQYDYVHRQAGDPIVLKDRLLRAYAARCPAGWPTGPDDGYFFEHLSYHLVAAGREEELEKLLLDFDWLQAQRAYSPALRTYIQDIRRVLASTVAQGLDGLPCVIAYGLLRGTLATRGYELTSEQIKQMIEAYQVSSILEWAESFPDGDWFKIDLIQVAGEVAMLAGQPARAVNELRRAAMQVIKLPYNISFMMSQYLESIAIDLVMLNDEEGIELVLAIAEQMPDFFWNQKAETIQALRQIQEHIKQAKTASQFCRELGFEPYPAIKKLTSENYVRQPPRRVLYAAEQSAWAWASWAEVLKRCDDADRSRHAFTKAQAASDLMGQDEHQHEKSRTLGRLAEVAKVLDQPESEVKRLLDEAIATAERPPLYMSQINAQVFLANLSVKLGYTEQAIRLLKLILRQFRVERPMMVNRAIWLSQLAPCVRLLREPSAVLADWIEDESVRQVVDQTWQAYLGNIEAAKALLTIMDSIQDVSEANFYLIHGSLKAIIPLLTRYSHDLPLERALAVSRRVLPQESWWLDWLGEVLSAVSVDHATATTLAQSLKDLYIEAPQDAQVQLALHIALPLARLPVLDHDWVFSLVHRVFSQERPYHRSSALEALEKFAPLVLALAGPRITVETWDRIQAVEQLFE